MAAGLVLWLGSLPGINVVGCAADGESGINLCMATQPTLVLVDLGLPRMDGLELARQLVELQPRVRLLVVSGFTDAHTIWRVCQSPVHGYLEKAGTPAELEQAIRTVAAGGVFYSGYCQQVKRVWLGQAESFQKLLSPREQEVLARVASGEDDSCIGPELGITPITVGAHRKHIRQKLGLHSDRGLVAYARRWGLGRQTAYVAVQP